MKRIKLILAGMATVLSAFAQQTVSETVLKQKTDSILREADILYRYESAAWVTTDMALEEKNIKKDFGGYLVYSSGDTVKTIVRSKSTGRRIYAVSFTTLARKPVLVEKTDRDLTPVEQNLWSVKDSLINRVFTPAYQIGIPEGFNPVIELIPSENGYKLYILMGTSQPNIIPLGNDYVFFADRDGKITNWRKFHSRLIAAQTSYNGQKIQGLIHSHLPSEPYITATDICTLRLYGPYTGIKSLDVLSTALSMYFKYDNDTHTISWGNVKK